MPPSYQGDTKNITVEGLPSKTEGDIWQAWHGEVYSSEMALRVLQSRVRILSSSTMRGWMPYSRERRITRELVFNASFPGRMIAQPARADSSLLWCIASIFQRPAFQWFPSCRNVCLFTSSFRRPTAPHCLLRRYSKYTIQLLKTG